MANSSQIATPAVYVTDDVGLEVTDGTNVRVQLGDISANNDGSSYGLKVISSDGSTVIIDGTSDMFRILGNFTQSGSAPTAGAWALTTDLTGLGLFSTTPAFTSFVSDNNVTGANQHLGRFLATNVQFDAVSSGGAVTNRFMGITYYAAGVVRLASTPGPDFARIVLGGNNESGSTQNMYARYYILAQNSL